MTSTNPRICVIVAGMHRSGTSALSHFLNILGCAPALELTGPNQSNETGHWEPEPIRALNDIILAAEESSWDDWTPLPQEWFATSTTSDFFAAACKTFSAQYAHADLVVMKDPRISRMLPFWISVVRACGYELRFVASIRNPLEVSASLQRRDGIDPAYAYLLWLRHVLDAEFHSRGHLRCFVSYENLLSDWRAVARSISQSLAIDLPGACDGSDREIDAYLNAELRHHHSAPEALGADPSHLEWMVQSYAILKSWSEVGETKADYDALDAIRLDLGKAGERFGALVTRGNAALRLAAEHAEVISQLRQLLAQTETILADQAAKARDLDRRFTELWHRSEAERAELQEARAVMDRWKTDN